MNPSSYVQARGSSLHEGDRVASVEAPQAFDMALPGVKVWNSIDWTRPDDARFEVTVRALVHQPQRAGALHS